MSYRQDQPDAAEVQSFPALWGPTLLFALLGTIFTFLGVGLLAGWLPASFAAGRSQTTEVPAMIGLDHIPIAVNDLERAAERFRALGFVLKPGRPHANGLRNEHAKFPDGTELELITAPEARDDLTTTYRRHLSDGDGPAFLAFYAPPTFKPTQPVPPYIFFGGRQHSPTDRPEHFAHPNGADAFISVWLAGDDLSRERALLAAHGATFARETVHVPGAMVADVARLWDGDVLFLPGARQRVKGRPIVGATVRVKSAAVARRVIEKGGATVRVAPGGSSIFVGPDAANGLWLEFRQAPGEARQPRTPLEMADAYLRATAARDIAATSALFAENAVYEDVTFAFQIKGRAAIADMFRGAFGAVAPVERRILRRAATADTVFVEWTASGPHVGPMLGVPPSNKPITLKAVSIIEVRDGLIQRVTDYMDRAGLESQLGVRK